MDPHFLLGYTYEKYEPEVSTREKKKDAQYCLNSQFSLPQHIKNSITVKCSSNTKSLDY